jgi:hypothetical protein
MPAPCKDAFKAPPQPVPSKSFFDHLLSIVPFFLLLALSYRGIDFGTHWDEHHEPAEVTNSLYNGCTLLPGEYMYPGVNYWLTVGTLLPEIYHTVKQVGPDATALQAALVPVVNSEAFLLRLRHVYAFVTALTAIWIYLTVLVWGGTRLEALVSSLLIATSFEVIYHSRWVAPDSIMMQFGALTLLLLAVAWKKESILALRFAAVAAGLACGTKYPGALLFLPVILLVPFLQAPTQGSWWRRLLRCAGLGAIFGLTYLVSTPGTLLQPIAFFQSLLGVWNVYAYGWYGYKVNPGLEHLGKILVYFATAVFSNFWPVAVVLFSFVWIGAWTIIRENIRSVLIVLFFPAIYLLYFSRQETMVVRNYLVVVPFAAFLAGRGIAWLHHRLPSAKARIALAAIVTGLLTINLVDQIKAANSVAHRSDTAQFTAELVRYIKQQPDRVFLVSDKLIPVLREQHLWPGPNLRPASGGVQQPFDEYVAYYSETVGLHSLQWPTNRRHSFVAIFGPREVNFDYYTGWFGDDRIVSLSEAFVRGMIARGVELP